MAFFTYLERRHILRNDQATNLSQAIDRSTCSPLYVKLSIDASVEEQQAKNISFLIIHVQAARQQRIKKFLSRTEGTLLDQLLGILCCHRKVTNMVLQKRTEKAFSSIEMACFR